MLRWALFLLLSTSFLAAQNDSSTTTKDPNSSNDKVTVRGCVDRSRSDYILIRQNPAITYVLQGSSQVKLRNYLGQTVEVTGKQQSTLSTSSDALAQSGSPSPLTIRVSSIKSVSKECAAHPVPSQ